MSSSSDSSAVTITSTVVGGIVVVAIAVLIYMCRRSKKRPVHASPATTTTTTSGAEATLVSASGHQDLEIEVPTIEKFLDDILKEKPIRFTPQQLLHFTSNYSDKLGSGGFGVVYKGQLPNGVLVAVKLLHKTLDKQAEEQFMAEVGTIGRTYHVNLVRLYGFCFDAEVKALVYEYMENGSLDRYLFDKSKRIEWGKLHEIAVGTAKGIRYLHEECSKRIVHYDIKPANVLIGADFSPKVADFGLAKLCDRENTHLSLIGGRGTPGYAAPELWRPFPVTHKCDVYSFGMLLFEIVGRRRNVEFGQAESQEWFPRWVWQRFEQSKLEQVMSLCEIDEKDREKARKMCKLALWCVQYKPEARPSMSSVVRMLEGQEAIVPPVNPFLYVTADEAMPDLTSVGTADESEVSSSWEQSTLIQAPTVS